MDKVFVSIGMLFEMANGGHQILSSEETQALKEMREELKLNEDDGVTRVG